MNSWVELSIAFVTGVLGPILVILLKNFLDKRKQKPDMVRETLKVSELINQKIEVLVPKKHDHSHVQLRNKYNKNPLPRSMGKGMNLYGKKKDG